MLKVINVYFWLIEKKDFLLFVNYVGKFLFVKIIISLADIQIKFTHVYLSV
jgi:hypothetical protein